MAVDGSPFPITMIIMGISLILIVLGRLSGEKFRAGGSAPLTSLGMLLVLVVCVLIVANEFSEAAFEGAPIRIR
jgi:hypothetical protein